MTHPFDSFERIYIINLASRADRRAEMAEQLRSIGLGFNSAAVRLFDAIRPTDAGPFPSIGSRGCFMSHLGVLKDAVAAGFQRILIVEDDLNFAPDFAQRSERLVARIAAPDWGMFYGGHEVPGHPSALDGAVDLKPEEPVQTTHFVALQGPTVNAAAAYLAAMLLRPSGDADGGPMHVDGAYSWFRREYPHVRTWIAVPPLGYQRASRTDIHALRWFDKMRAVRDVASMLRRLRNRR